jgi:hypothetical protein
LEERGRADDVAEPLILGHLWRRARRAAPGEGRGRRGRAIDRHEWATPPRRHPVNQPCNTSLPVPGSPCRHVVVSVMATCRARSTTSRQPGDAPIAGPAPGTSSSGTIDCTAPYPRLTSDSTLPASLDPYNAMCDVCRHTVSSHGRGHRDVVTMRPNGDAHAAQYDARVPEMWCSPCAAPNSWPVCGLPSPT